MWLEDAEYCRGGEVTRTRTNYTEGRSALRLDESTGGLRLWPALDLGFNNEIHKELLFFMRCTREGAVLITSDLFNQNNVLWKNRMNTTTERVDALTAIPRGF